MRYHGQMDTGDGSIGDWIAQHWEMLTAWVGSIGAGALYAARRLAGLEARVAKVELDLVHLGTLQQTQLQEIKDLAIDVRDRLASQETAVKEFWRDRWPAVEGYSAHIDAIREDIRQLRDDARDHKK